MSANVYRFDLQTRGWWPQCYPVTPTCMYLDEGEGLANLLMGASSDIDTDGLLYNMGVGTDDDGEAICVEVITPALDLGDTRAQKLFLDYILDAEPDQTDIHVTPLVNNLLTALTAATITGTSRDQTPVPMADTALELYRNIAVEICWESDRTPILLEFQPNALLQPFLARNISTQFQTHGWGHYGHLRDAEIVYISITEITFALTPGDGSPSPIHAFTLPSSGGQFAKYYLVLPPLKGKMFRYNAYSESPFVLFTDETVVHLKEWGDGGAYRAFYPFIGQTPMNQTGV